MAVFATMSDAEIVAELGKITPINQARKIFSSMSATIEQGMQQRVPLGAIEVRRTEFEAVQKISEVLNGAVDDLPVAYRFRHSLRENWYYGETCSNWWEWQALYTRPTPSEVVRLQGELAKANQRIEQLEVELTKLNASKVIPETGPVGSATAVASDVEITELKAWCNARKKDKPWYDSETTGSPKLQLNCDVVLSLIARIEASSTFASTPHGNFLANDGVTGDE